MFVHGLASILHADLDAFYASVEQRDNPELRGRPVFVGGGVVLAASYEAKARGVRTPMNGNEARRLCPEGVFVSPRMEAYSAASKDVFDIFHDTTPMVEGISIDEAFLEVGGLGKISGNPQQIAQRLRARVASEVGLNITVGVARTKFLAKVASGVAKPNGLLIVDPDRELEFLRPLEVERLWGVGKVTAEKLHDVDLHTVGEVADLPLDTLIGMVGVAAGRKLHALAHNRDPRPVTARKRRSSIGSQRAMGRGPKSQSDIDGILRSIVDRVTHRLRQGERVGRTVVLRFRFDDFTRATRSHTLSTPTSDTELILGACDALLSSMSSTIKEKGLTLLGLSITNLSSADAVQLALPFADGTSLDDALDDVRERFGSSAINRATNVHRDEGFSVPMLPDPPS
ncbi:MAG: DNA polymerase IV [Acidimicrobiales bacterium]|nr:MAG: DNA polymerase IV [Acidimicrobiales bacterium]